MDRFIVYYNKNEVTMDVLHKVSETRKISSQYQIPFQQIDLSVNINKENELMQKMKNNNWEFPIIEYQRNFFTSFIGNYSQFLLFLNLPLDEKIENNNNNNNNANYLEKNSVVNCDEDENSHGQNTEKESVEIEEVFEEEEEEEPTLGYISGPLEYIEQSVKSSMNWINSFFRQNNKEENEKDQENNNNNNINNNNNNNYNNNEKEENNFKQYKVIQTNWYYRSQNRIIRFDFAEKKFYRIDPYNNAIRAMHSFNHLRDLATESSSQSFRLCFIKSDEEENNLIYEDYHSSVNDFDDILLHLTLIYSERKKLRKKKNSNKKNIINNNNKNNNNNINNNIVNNTCDDNCEENNIQTENSVTNDQDQDKNNSFEPPQCYFNEYINNNYYNNTLYFNDNTNNELF